MLGPRKLFGSLNLVGNVSRGENPSGFVSQTSNGTNVNGAGSDGEQPMWEVPASGPRWNDPVKTAPLKMRS